MVQQSRSRASALNLIYLLGTDDGAAAAGSRRSSPVCRAPTRSGVSAKATIGSSRGLSAGCPAARSAWGSVWWPVRSAGTAGTPCTFSCGDGLMSVRADHVVFALPFTKLREVEMHGIELPRRQQRASRGTAGHEREDPDAVLPRGVERRSLDGEHVHRRHRPGRLGDDGGPAGTGDPDRLPAARWAQTSGRRYRLGATQGPRRRRWPRLPGKLDQNFPGARQAYNGGTTSPGEPGIRTWGRVLLPQARPVHRVQRHPGTAERNLRSPGSTPRWTAGIHGRRAAQRLPLRGGDRQAGASLIRALADRRRTIAALSCPGVSARGLRALHRRFSGVTGRGQCLRRGNNDGFQQRGTGDSAPARRVGLLVVQPQQRSRLRDSVRFC